MKKRNIIGFLFIVCLVMILPANAGQKSDPVYGITADADQTISAVPVAVAMEPRFKFSQVIEGTVITHDFIIKNAGDGPLFIEKVITTCGCTTVSYPKEIEPGAEGKITIKGDTRGYAGRRFSKSITVRTNDPRHKEFKLGISGKVDRFAQIEPKRVFLRGPAGDKIQSVVSITPEKKYPFSILESYSDNLENKVEIILEKTDDRYVCTVNNLMKTPGRYRGRIYLRTDSPVKPEIIVYIFGTITGKKS